VAAAAPGEDSRRVQDPASTVRRGVRDRLGSAGVDEECLEEQGELHSTSVGTLNNDAAFDEHVDTNGVMTTVRHARARQRPPRPHRRQRGQ